MAPTSMRPPNPMAPPRSSNRTGCKRPPPNGGNTATGHAGATSLARAGLMKDIPAQNNGRSGSNNATAPADQSSWADDCISDVELAAMVIGTPLQTTGSANKCGPTRPQPSTQPSNPARAQCAGTIGGDTGKTIQPDTTAQSSRIKRRAEDDISGTVDISQPDSYAATAHKKQFKEPHPSLSCIQFLA